ncbi:Cross-pathway control protein 1 [Tolypocladium ophioglossoides CBS 100239]|uniref:Cross-pathway control protein 1 n=1 Tax=Tolypocladium ophioglossoides (strain CBS 100239) TaxID=1163406 RepID=A0A0L0MXB7_TOLOC|nr:Cross-pathway control protein 1 [Tolypocladium ophioglossoides CBS 100239]
MTLLLFSPPPNIPKPPVTDLFNASGGHQDAINQPLSRVAPPQSVKIQSPDNNIFPTQSNPSSVHHPVDLNFSIALNSISSSSPYSTANISAPDFPVFTTDSQSTWLPNSTSALPAPSAQQPLNPAESPQQDFVLFDNPQPRPSPSRSASPLPSQRRHSYHNRPDKFVAASAFQNQRVAQILQGIGHQSLSSVNANRFANQFYASSAPSSTVSLNPNQQKTRSARPPVPLFSVRQSAKMMNAADVDLDEFTAFEGGASTAFSSPALTSAMDFNGSISSSTSNLGTVSPHDLLVQEPFMSAPNSSALTALTSPSIYNESADFDEFDISPNFGSADFDGSGDPWYPLFPQDSHSGPEQTQSLDDSPAQKSDDIDSVSRGSSGSGRKKSTGSPTGGSGRHSSVAGVNSRKRDKPLPPIIVEDPGDTVAMKRALNTLAARKSRERKAQRFEELEERIAKLEAERDHWKKIALSQ